jgi:hypothetical protein
VPEADHLGAGQFAAVVDAGVAVAVDDQHVAGPGEGADHAEVGQVAGREHDRFRPAIESRQFAL